MRSLLPHLLFALLLAAAVRAEDLRFRLQLQPPEATLDLLGNLSQRKLARTRVGKDWICTVPREWLSNPKSSVQSQTQLRFSHEGYQARVIPFNRDTFDRLAEDPQNPGVRVMPMIRLQPDAGMAVRLFWDNNRYSLLLLLGLLGVGAVAGLTKVLEARRSGARLAKIEELSQHGGSDPMVGLKLGEYLLTRRLGSGGMAVVYQAIPFDNLDEKSAVAIKVLQEARSDPDFLDRFRREVEITRTLNHRNCLRLFGWGEQDQVFFLIMELVEGHPLRPPVGGMPLQQFQSLLPGLLEGLIYAHERGIVHRDLKPDNLMLTPGGEVKIMDFGLARGHDMTRITGTGTALGTPAYMPPEQILGEPPTPLADQYSLGLTLYELLTGKRPFEQTDLMAMIQAQLQEEPMPLSMYRDDLSIELEQVIMQMICKQPERRFPTMRHVQGAFQEALSVRP